MNKNDRSKLFVMGAAGVVMLLVFGGFGVYRASGEYKEITVNRMERVVKSESSYYLLFADEGVFRVSDSMSFFHFSASELYGKFKKGNRYQVYVAGWRVPFLSMYENVIRINEDMGPAVKDEADE